MNKIIFVFLLIFLVSCADTATNNTGDDNNDNALVDDEECPNGHIEIDGSTCLGGSVCGEGEVIWGCVIVSDPCMSGGIDEIVERCDENSVCAQIDYLPECVSKEEFNSLSDEWSFLTGTWKEIARAECSNYNEVGELFTEGFTPIEIDFSAPNTIDNEQIREGIFFLDSAAGSGHMNILFQSANQPSSREFLSYSMVDDELMLTITPRSPFHALTAETIDVCRHVLKKVR